MTLIVSQAVSETMLSALPYKVLARFFVAENDHKRHRPNNYAVRDFTALEDTLQRRHIATKKKKGTR
jgi:hypothetical protein